MTSHGRPPPSPTAAAHHNTGGTSRQDMLPSLESSAGSRKRRLNRDNAPSDQHQLLFQTVFAPLAHHFFPDGLPHNTLDSDGEEYTSHEEDTPEMDEREESGVFAMSQQEARWLWQCWPPRDNRNAVTPLQAKRALTLLRSHVSGTKSALHHFTAGQILALAVVARASLLVVVGTGAVGGGSRLVDSTSFVFVQLIRCMIPCQQVPPSVLYMLLSLATSTPCDLLATGAIFRFLTLGIRHGSMALDTTTTALHHHKSIVPLHETRDNSNESETRRKRARTDSMPPLDANNKDDAADTDDSWIVHSEVLYSAVLSTMMRLSTTGNADLQADTVIGDATRLLYVMTRRRHVNPFRAQLLHQIYRQHGNANLELEETTTATDKKQSSWHNSSLPSLLSPLDKSSSTGTRSGSRAKNLQRERNRTLLSLLLQLYARYDPRGCTKYLQPGPRISSGKEHGILHYLRVPDQGWEEDFGRSPRRFDDPGVPIRNATSLDEYHGTNRALSQDLLERFEEACEANGNGRGRTFWDSWLLDSHSVLGFQKARASAWLCHKAWRHWIVLHLPRNSAAPENGEEEEEVEAEVMRFRSCLSLLMHEEWNLANVLTKDDVGASDGDTSSGDNGDESDDAFDVQGSSFYCEEHGGFRAVQGDADGRRKAGQRLAGRKIHGVRLQRQLALLDAMASFAEHADGLLPEMEGFLLDVVLPLWDGADGPLTELLCHGCLLRMLRPLPFALLERKLLKRLAQIFPFASPRVKYSMVTGILAPLVARWGRLFSFPSREGASPKQQALETKEEVPMWRTIILPLIRWTDSWMLSGLVVDSRVHGAEHELVRVSALDFYNAVCDLASREESVSLAAMVPLPSSGLVYQMLLGNTAWSVDRLCGLLLRYKDLLQQGSACPRKKQKGNNDGSSTDESIHEAEPLDDDDDDDVTHQERVQLFNCYVFDICNLLWRCAPLPFVGDDGMDDAVRSNSILFTDLREDTFKAMMQLPVEEGHLSSFLSITQGLAFGGHASDFLLSRNGDEENKPLSPKALQGAVKVEYLDYLRDKCNYPNLHRFLSFFVSSLVERNDEREPLAS